jgi:hypothetical protein
MARGSSRLVFGLYKFMIPLVFGLYKFKYPGIDVVALILI